MRLLLPRNHGVLGINARNLNYFKPFNPSKAVAFADDKLKTKIFLETRGIPVPKLYAKIASRDELRTFDFDALPDTCALKPNFGYGGEGIFVLVGRERGGFRTASGKHISYEELFEHIEDILDGMYSLNHRRDTAFFEQLITVDDSFAALNPVGLPDIRIVVHNLVPVMGMIRLPTKNSDGKANLHMGGIGLGIDLAKGMTTFGVQHNKRIALLPNGKPVSGFKIAHWDAMLLIASRIQQMTNIGFLGVDLTIDKTLGPVLLEVNARAGLAVQTANLAALGKRMQRVAGLKVGSPEKGVRMAQDLFGEKIESKEKKKSDAKPVLATREGIEILGGKKSVTVPAMLRPDHDRTVFDPELLKELEEFDAVEKTQDGTYRVKFSLGGKKMSTIVHAVSLDEPGVRASIGRRDLAGFLVDPGKQSESIIGVKVDLKRIDKQLADIDRKMQLLKHIRPENLADERAKLDHDIFYNPVFSYGELSFDANELLDRLRYLGADTSPLGQILEKKRQEIMRKIALLEARGQNDRFTQCSIAIFGKPEPHLLKQARDVLHHWKNTQSQSFTKDRDMLSSEEVRELFLSVLAGYGLRHWNVRVTPNTISDCAVARGVLLLRRGASFSRERAMSLVAHEIETHVLTMENGNKQPYEIFSRGFAGYGDTQEGLAVFNQNRILSENNEKRFWSPMQVLAVHYGLTHSFAQLRAYVRRLGFDDICALRTAFKIKRGMNDTGMPGAFTKELVYFRGWKRICEFVEQGGELKELYIGKITIQDLGLVREIPGLINPVYLPK
jgi:alpha-L-glutamate ligase-like protein/uncharacterized protein (TIGR02421 family)